MTRKTITDTTETTAVTDDELAALDERAAKLRDELRFLLRNAEAASVSANELRHRRKVGGEPVEKAAVRRLRTWVATRERALAAFEAVVASERA
jgi:hypothetical protein